MTLDERIEAARKLDGYTPGPWRVGIDDDGNPLSGRPGVFSSDELDCGIVHWDGFVQEYWRSARGDKEIHDNARLVAAAPDLHRLALDLAAERERLRADLDQGAKDYCDLMDQRDAQHVRIEKLKAALRPFVAYVHDDLRKGKAMYELVATDRAGGGLIGAEDLRRARAALASEPDA